MYLELAGGPGSPTSPAQNSCHGVHTGKIQKLNAVSRSGLPVLHASKIRSCCTLGYRSKDWYQESNQYPWSLRSYRLPISLRTSQCMSTYWAALGAVEDGTDWTL